jgi:hypothetical protein
MIRFTRRSVLQATGGLSLMPLKPASGFALTALDDFRNWLIESQ